MKEMQLTAEMLREAFRQTQREILEIGVPERHQAERYQARWERMAALLNEKIAEKMPENMALLSLDEE